MGRENLIWRSTYTKVLDNPQTVEILSSFYSSKRLEGRHLHFSSASASRLGKFRGVNWWNELVTIIISRMVETRGETTIYEKLPIREYAIYTRTSLFRVSPICIWLNSYQLHWFWGAIDTQIKLYFGIYFVLQMVKVNIVIECTYIQR